MAKKVMLATRSRPKVLMPFGEVPYLLKPFEESIGMSERELAKKLRDNPYHPISRHLTMAVVRSVNAYGRYGMYDEEGLLQDPRNTFAESGTGLSPDATPDFFNRPDSVPATLGNSIDFAPDTTYLEWLRSEPMDDEWERREDWDMDFNWVKIKEEGQVKYSSVAATSSEVTNEEYGSGLHIRWTWLETNKFRINLQRMVPKAKFAYFDMISDAAYALLASTITTAGTVTQNVIRDFNVAFGQLQRTLNWFGREAYANATFHVVTAKENRWIIEGAQKMSRNENVSNESFAESFTVTYTTKLAAPTSSSAIFYILIKGHEKNLILTRVPFTVTPQQDDIETFSRKMAFRGAHGLNMDSTSGLKLTFDPSNANFVLNGPIGVRTI